ncbi:18150_t:CDS:10 [Acaulospora morrowiae]|uniref:18150_t:CDS:1 n=2 Tax=Acaulospora morrowiae TaxID=94023 RepID=A0A9N9EE61_9GLOM|nr:18150_t:CDS:10 [Acaulospora morrowiae]
MDKQAEEQNVKLEQKLENLKSKMRTGSPTGNSRVRLDDIESRNFTLEEEVKDLRIQLSGKKNELEKAVELANKRTADLEKAKAEYDEKMKRMRGVFNAANKNLNELRQTVALKDLEIEELKAAMKNLKEDDEKSKSSMDQNQKSLEKLTTELHSQAATYNTQIEQLESKLRQTTQQNVQLKSEFQQYKARAHALLQQRNSGSKNVESGTDVSELLATTKKLESDLSLKITELKYAQDKIMVHEKDLKHSFDLNGKLEKELEEMHKSAKVNAEEMRATQEQCQNLLEENEGLRKALHEAEARYTASVNDFNERLLVSTETIQKKLKQKQEENEQLQSISEASQLTQLRSELSQRSEQIEELQKQLSIASAGKAQSISNSPALRDDSRSASPSSVTHRNSTHNSLSDLLADTEERTSIVSSSTLTLSDKEQDHVLQLQHMAEMLNESEAHVQRLIEQEKILKEEIRKLDRLEKRQNINVEYLKNVVLKFFETDPSDREPLVPVISTILQLSPEEIQSIRENALNATDNGQVVIGYGVL